MPNKSSKVLSDVEVALEIIGRHDEQRRSRADWAKIQDMLMEAANLGALQGIKIQKGLDKSRQEADAARNAPALPLDPIPIVWAASGGRVGTYETATDALQQFRPREGYEQDLSKYPERVHPR